MEQEDNSALFTNLPEGCIIRDEGQRSRVRNFSIKDDDLKIFKGSYYKKTSEKSNQPTCRKFASVFSYMQKNNNTSLEWYKFTKKQHEYKKKVNADNDRLRDKVPVNISSSLQMSN